jgi:hypothetical protein
MHTTMHCFKHHYIALDGEQRERQRATTVLIQYSSLVMGWGTAAAALGKVCTVAFLLLDFPGLNQVRGAGRDSNPRLPYSSPAY